MPEPTESVTTAIGGVLGGLVIVVGMWLRNYQQGRAEGSEDVHGKHVILEQAELRDFGALPQDIREIGRKLEISLQVNAAARDKIDDLARKIEEQLRILRRMEGELEIAKRLREEKILRVRQRDEE